MNPLRVVPLMLLGVAFVGCGDGRGGPSDSTIDAGPRQYGTVEGAIAGAICDRSVRCEGEGPSFFHSDVPGCILNIATTYLDPVEDALSSASPNSTFDRLVAIDDSIAAGKIELDHAKLDTCLVALRALNCRETMWPLTRVTGCGDVFVGKVPTGGACIASAACEGHALCVPQSGSESCSGTCRPLGEVCRADPDCDAMHICNGGKCITTENPAGEKVGDPCGDTSTFGSNRCLNGLTCQASGSDYACLNPRKEGDRCTDGYDCPAALQCMSVEGALKTCERPATDVAAGKACDPSDVRCASGLSCLVDFDQPAICFTPKKKGESCELPFECAYTADHPLYCSGTEHVCVEPPSSGPCPVVTDIFSLGCAANAYCDESHTCQPRAPLGGACQTGQLCMDRNEVCDKSTGARASDPGVCVVQAGPARCAP